MRFCCDKMTFCCGVKNSGATATMARVCVGFCVVCCTIIKKDRIDFSVFYHCIYIHVSVCVFLYSETLFRNIATIATKRLKNDQFTDWSIDKLSRHFFAKNTNFNAPLIVYVRFLLLAPLPDHHCLITIATAFTHMAHDTWRLHMAHDVYTWRLHMTFTHDVYTYGTWHRAHGMTFTHVVAWF
jgi:hypothetical protein